MSKKLAITVICLFIAFSLACTNQTNAPFNVKDVTRVDVYEYGSIPTFSRKKTVDDKKTAESLSKKLLKIGKQPEEYEAVFGGKNLTFYIVLNDGTIFNMHYNNYGHNETFRKAADLWDGIESDISVVNLFEESDNYKSRIPNGN